MINEDYKLVKRMDGTYTIGLFLYNDTDLVGWSDANPYLAVTDLDELEVTNIKIAEAIKVLDIVNEEDLPMMGRALHF